MGSADESTLGSASNPESKKKSPKDKVLERLRDPHCAELFHNKRKIAFTTFFRDDRVPETYAVHSDGWRDRIDAIAFQLGIEGLRQADIRDIEASATARARNVGIRREVHLRTALHEGVLYIDRTTDDWSAYRVTPQGWDIVAANELPVRFEREMGAEPLPNALLGEGDYKAIQTFMNVPDEHLPTLALFQLSALFPATEYPILVLGGLSNTGKTVACRYLKRLQDPTDSTEVAFPDNTQDIWLQAMGQHIVFFAEIPKNVAPKIETTLRLIATGGGNNKRKLYTNDSLAKQRACRPLLLNSVHDFIRRPDLANRTLFLTLPPLTQKQRTLGSSDLEREFRTNGGRVLAALLDGLSLALRERQSMDLHGSVFRMQEGLKTAMAAAPALGLTARSILDAANQGLADRERQDTLDDVKYQALTRILVGPRTTFTWIDFINEMHGTAPAGIRDQLPTTAQGWRNWLDPAAPRLEEHGDLTFRYEERVRSTGAGRRPKRSRGVTFFYDEPGAESEES